VIILGLHSKAQNRKAALSGGLHNLYGRSLSSAPTSAAGFTACDGERPHQRRWCFGKTPMQILIDAKPLAKEKMIAAFTRSTGGSDPYPDAVCQNKFQVPHLAPPHSGGLPPINL